MCSCPDTDIDPKNVSEGMIRILENLESPGIVIVA